MRRKGYPEASGTFALVTAARRWVKYTKAPIRAGRYVATAEAKRHTFADLVDRYIKEDFRLKKKNGSNKEQP